MSHRQPADMRLVDNRVMPRHPRWPVVSPGKRRIDDAALRCTGRAVTFVERQVILAMPNSVAEVGVAPDDVALEMLGVRFDQKLVRVEAVTSFGIIRSIHPI